MPRDYWHKQTVAQPLFPDLLWSRPENKRAAGKLLIVGGNAFGFSAPAEAYQEASTAGAGTIKVLLPDALQKTVGSRLEAAEFAPTTPSGSFARQALDTALELAEWADGVLIAGDLGRNSETAILIESLVSKYDGPVTLSKDAVDYGYNFVLSLLTRGGVTLVLSLAQLQRLAKEARYPEAVTYDMDLLRLTDWVHGFTQTYPVNIIVLHLDTFFVSTGGEVSTTKTVTDEKIWRVKTAAHAAVWGIQHPKNIFSALSTSVVN